MSKAPIRKDKLRPNAPQLRGPLWVPESIKQKYQGYQLRWIGVSNRDSYTIGQYQDLGYTFVTKDDVADTEMGESNLSRTYIEGGKVCTGTGDNTKAYLMKIPQELFDEFCEYEEEKIVERRRQLGEIAKSPNIYGKIEFGDESAD